MNWQPIETAPKDGRVLMLYFPDGQMETGPVTIGRYFRFEHREENGRFKKGAFYPADWSGWLAIDADLSPSWGNPTHWAPMPVPPAMRAGETSNSTHHRNAAEEK